MIVFIALIKRVHALSDFVPPADTDAARVVHGLWPTDNACKHFGDKSKTIYWNNIAGPNWKAYYDKVKGYCDGAGSGNTNPQWRHPFPCKPYLHEYYGGALDSKQYGRQTDGKFRHEALMAALATAAANDDGENGPRLMCEWFAGDRDWGGVESNEAPAHARDERPCGCYFSPIAEGPGMHRHPGTPQAGYPVAGFPVPGYPDRAFGKGAFYFNDCKEEGAESDVSCGTNGRYCACMSLVDAATAAPACDDGIKSGSEDGVDCGGLCTPCHCPSQFRRTPDCNESAALCTAMAWMLTVAESLAKC